MAAPTAFSSRDPLSPQFWDERFERAFTPWERGGVSMALRRFVAAATRPLVALAPGCGTAHELALMCEAGWDATAIDFSPEAVARARALAGPWADRIVQADFFNALNHTNLGTPNRFVNTAQFGTITDAATPGREVQLSARLSF